MLLRWLKKILAYGLMLNCVCDGESDNQWLSDNID